MKLRSLCASAFLTALYLASSTVNAEELGKYGNTWEIQEQDAIDMIQGRLKAMDQKGELDKFWNDYRDKQLAGVENPKPVSGIGPVVEPQIRMYDPTYTYPETVKDHLGNILVPAGTPQDRIDKLTAAFDTAMKSDQVQAALSKVQSRFMDMDGDEMAAFIAAERDKWSAIIEAAGIEKR